MVKKKEKNRLYLKKFTFDVAHGLHSNQTNKELFQAFAWKSQPFNTRSTNFDY